MAWSDAARRAALEARRRRAKGNRYSFVQMSDAGQYRSTGTRRQLLSFIGEQKRIARRGVTVGSNTYIDPEYRESLKKIAGENVKRARAKLYGLGGKAARRKFRRAKSMWDVEGH
jgi:hypothetical protein